MSKKKNKSEFNQKKFGNLILDEKSKKNSVIENYKKNLETNGVFSISNSELKFEETLRQKIVEHNRTIKEKKENKEKNENTQSDEDFEETISVDLKKAKNTFSNLSYEKNSELKSLYYICSAFSDQKTYSNYFKIRRDVIYAELSSLNFTRKGDFLYDKEKINVIEINNLSDFSSKILELENESLNLYFRGQANLNWKVQPGIVRNNPDFESEYFNKTLLHFPAEFEKEQTNCEKLARMQHFGIPTRLLDITENPYIALFFACKSNFEDYGEVRVYNPDNQKIKNYNDTDLNRNLNKIFNENKNLKLENCVLFGKYSNRRIQNQRGLFIFCGDISENFSVDDLEYKNKDENKKLVFVISGKSKKHILDELEILGITEEFVYPDIENSAIYLKNRFQRESNKQNNIEQTSFKEK